MYNHICLCGKRFKDERHKSLTCPTCQKGQELGASMYPTAQLEEWVADWEDFLDGYGKRPNMPLKYSDIVRELKAREKSNAIAAILKGKDRLFR